MEIKPKLYLTILFLTAVLAAFSLFLTRPFYQKIKELSGRFTAGNEELAVSEAKKRYGKNFESDLKNLSGEISAAEEAAVQKNNLVGAIEFLEKSAADSTVNIELKSVETPAKGDSVVFRISLFGNFAGVFRFVKFLENGPYFVSFGDFVFRRLEKFTFDAAKLKVPVGEGAISADLEITFLAK